MFESGRMTFSLGPKRRFPQAFLPSSRPRRAVREGPIAPTSTETTFQPSLQLSLLLREHKFVFCQVAIAKFDESLTAVTYSRVLASAEKFVIREEKFAIKVLLDHFPRQRLIDRSERLGIEQARCSYLEGRILRLPPLS
jgi:hypothetical protein